MSKPTTVTYICPTCEAETEVSVYPVIPARIYGPPEDCYPEEGGEFEPDKCECGKEIDAEKVTNQAAEKAADDYDDYLESRVREDRDI